MIMFSYFKDSEKLTEDWRKLVVGSLISNLEHTNNIFDKPTDN